MNPNNEPKTNPVIELPPVLADVISQPVVTSAVISDINLTTGKVVDPNKQRHFLAAFFLSYIFGVFGADRFYLGKIWTGVLKFLTFGGMGVWALIDLNVIVSGGMRDIDGNKLLQADRYKKFAVRMMWISSLAIMVVVTLFSAILIFIVSNFMQSGGLDGIIQSMLGGQTTNLINPDQLNLLNLGL